jgi:hypothetical protein
MDSIKTPVVSGDVSELMQIRRPTSLFTSVVKRRDQSNFHFGQTPSSA